MSKRQSAFLKQFLDELRPYLTSSFESAFAERLKSDQLSPDQIVHAYFTYHGMLSESPDVLALFAALDALVKGTPPYFDGIDSSLREAGKIMDKERARIARMPVPAVAFEGLNKNVKSDWTLAHYGERRFGAKWKNATEEVLYCSVTFEREGEYSDHFYFYAEDEYWHEGIPLSTERPLYRLPEILNSELPVLVVLGGRAASIEVPGYVVTTFSGGSSTCTDWAPLAERAVTVWPATIADLRAAAAIKKRLPHSRVLDAGMKSITEIPAAEISVFITGCPVVEMPGDAGAKLPFSFLGFDTSRYWFLPRKRRVPYTIDMGRFSSSQLLELAALGWWGVSGMVRDNGAIKTDTAQDWVVAEQEKVGMVDLRRLRGAGVWRDGDQIVVNDGAQIVTMKGACLDYDSFKSADAAEYIPSETRFGDMTGEESTDAEGEALVALFRSQSFGRKIDPMSALGWALVAPFGGLLAWRPHIWITGRRGTGKSMVLVEKLIDPLIGEFAYQGTGRTSEPALRRAGHLTARPYRLDEFDIRAKSDAERLARIVNLIRNSSCDSTAVTTLASGESGTVTFIVRSCFCLVSVNVLDMDAAIESRFVRIEKMPVADIGTEIERMKRECSHVMAEPARYRRRIFRALPRILSDIAAIHYRLLSYLGDAREADVIGPLLCAAWAVQSGESIMGESGTSWCTGLLNDMTAMHADRIEDEERVIQHILEAPIRTDDQKTRTVAELLGTIDRLDGEADARALLARNGISLTTLKNGDGLSHRYLAVAQHSDAIQRILAGTPYEHGYEQQIKRHPLCRDGEASVVNIAGKSTRCRCLDWEGFRDQYLAATQGRLEGTE